LVKCPKCGKEVVFKGNERSQNDHAYSGYQSKMEPEDSDVYGCEDFLNCDYKISGKEFKRRQAEENDLLIKRFFS
jgi:ssDNA-binding Zn-finger/Zn-ribbon topoisomerase 1